MEHKEIQSYLISCTLSGMITVSLIVLFLPWLKFRSDQSCTQNCKLGGEYSENFTADCESEAMMDCVSCVMKANCPKITTTTIQKGVTSAYLYNCAYTPISVGELTTKDAFGGAIPFLTYEQCKA